MTILTNAFLVLHLLGAAAIIGPWLAAPRAGVVRMAMVWGARAQLLTGLALAGLVHATNQPVNDTKLGVKLVVAVACLACLEMANGRQRRAVGTPTEQTAEQAPGTSAGQAGGVAVTTATPVAATLVNAGVALAILNVVIAAMWH